MSALLAGALGTVLGLQVLRAFFPLLLYVLKDRFGQPSPALGAEAILLFATGFLAPRLVRGRHGLASALLALAVLRGALQLWKGDPAVSLALAAAAIPAFLAFLAADAPAKARAFLLGALLDASIHALAGTRDLHWGGRGADLAAGALVGAAIAAAMAVRRAADTRDVAPAALGLLAWGPFLALHLEILGNVARASARTSLPTAPSGAIVAAGLALAALAGPRIARAAFLRGAALPLLGVALLAPAILRAGSPGPLAIPVLAIAQLAAAVLLLRALAPASPRAAEEPGPRGPFFGIGSVLFVLLLFLHYAGYDLPLPLSRTGVHLAAVALLGIAALAARDATATPAPAGRAVTAAAALVALAPFLRGVPHAPPPDRDPAAAVVVTFNFHAGFDERGGWAFDRMLRELRAARPDVAALQEVSRGWVINGCADLFELTRESLGLRGVPAPSVGTDWGSAIFARDPIVAVRTRALPPRMHLARAATLAELDAEEGAPRRVIATHFHHRPADDTIRDVQARALVEAFAAGPDAILLGDFNAVPDSETFAILRAAGWRDAGGPPALARLAPTFPSGRPVRRIDTILAGDVARIVACDVAPPWGSDHRAVIARWRRTPGD